ncbi:PREDICTED: probable disease resistance protein RPP1 isoform X2 [Camelina sativa]|uniref:ADP-ribosyl cyclase/cyclic ADP-ribose hydrolase n=1 Tax=Camelina sativa TaxID=90675 RepID=A0ABM0Z2P1_CAMSA|nr:PREDICTED: probable disease resistance protein RPP1 isoform X2 [Camelina sativa]XP_010509568.1 PREDICTED: probable disease resistance protein RPP1 isoform X2 [Camelina sativa]
MGSVMSLSCSKRKATSQDVESESVKRRKICSTNDDENSSSIPSPPDDSSWSLCANRVVNVTTAVFTKFRFQQEDNINTKSSALPLRSPPTTLSQNCKHHVFPSFHGPDVRRTFLSHILAVFRGKGISPFIDNHIPRSKSIGPELKDAIRGSKIAIVLLSKNYASSSWCLDELAEIMNCREVSGQIVMTIFYEVDPTDIKKQTGDFGKAFRKSCKGKTNEHTERWRKALEDVATIAGYHSHRWVNEAAMIEKIAADVSNMLNSSTPSRDFDGLVGMRAHMEKLKLLLSLDLDEVRMIGIWGPPGIGKTTIARVVFNQVSNRFQLAAIMVNIKGCYPRPCLDEYSAQLQLQSQMLSQIINQKDLMISHLGVAQERLKDKKVFVVLDEVDQLGQLDALAKETQWFGPGSRIIITTEDLRVLNAHGINHIYKVDFPSSDKAFKIFCMYAFGKKYPDDGFAELAWEVTNLAGKLPLGLKVLGSALKGMSKQEWKRILPMLQTSLNGEIGSIIKFSYDALCDEYKDIFLYVACFFNGIFNGIVAHNLEKFLSKKLSHVTHAGIHVLAEKSLISIDQFGYIKMHTLLEQFGRETSRKEFLHNRLLKCQLLVDGRDICEVLGNDTRDNRCFIGIYFKLSEIEEELNISEKALERMSDLEIVIIEGEEDLAQPERLNSLLCHSQKIRLLYWSYFQNICLPSTFNPEFLVALTMHSSKLLKLWDGVKQLKNLRWMDLSDSKDLKELPDLSTATNLENLNLGSCSSLVEFPSIGNATKLKKLNLSNCSSLVEVPSSSIENLTNLRELDLSGYSNLVEFPSIGNATKLEILNLSNCSSLVEAPSSIENLTNLRELDLSGYSNLVELPSIGNATKLEKLNLRDCSRLEKFSSSINATNLRELCLTNCSRVMELPSMENATNLRLLDLHNCSSLLELPPSIGSATNLKQLIMSRCSSIVNLPTSIGDCTNLDHFELDNCSNLVELPSSIGKLQRLSTLTMCGCSKLEALPTNINLKSLRILDLTDCLQLKSFPEISTSLVSLRLTGTAIKEVPLSIMSWSRLFVFRMSYFESLREFPHALEIITELHLVNEDIQEVPPWVKGMSCLETLILKNCNNLVSLPQLQYFLLSIVADNCQSLERLDCSFNNLKFTNCFKLKQEARDLIMHTSTSGYAILPGTQVPACFNHRATAGGLLTIKLNELSFPTFLRFKACVMLVKEETDADHGYMFLYTNIKDKQNDLKVRCTRGSRLIDPLLTEHIYIFEVEAEETVISTELVFEFTTDSRKWKIGGCGVYQILKRQRK